MHHHLSSAASGPVEPLERFLADYRSYLEDERGLADLTVANYLQTARDFLLRRCAGDPAAVTGPTAADISRFVLGEAARGLSPRTVNESVVRLRSLLRYLYTKGMVAAPLAQATPWMAGSRAGSLPRTLDPSVGPRLLASCDSSTLVGVRDFAILSVLSRLGLRGREIAGLSCDDIAWRRAEVTVHGKGGFVDSLPLPADVGEAVAEYLERRGTMATRRVFCTVQEPWDGMTTTAVRAVVRRACARVGIDDTGTHRFRHAVATELLRRGAPLPEIGQLLRHHHLQTTALYAQVDFDALATLAQPWPGVRP
jgi:integrase/recombinase XerD